jgi:hypothetical protein
VRGLWTVATATVELTRAFCFQATKHAREISALEERLAWYRENQSIVDSDREALAKQAETISKLQALVVQLGGSADSVSRSEGPPGSSAPRADASTHGGEQASALTTGTADVASRQKLAVMSHQLVVAKRRILELEKDLREAQQSLDRRKPDSLASLIRAAKGADGAVGEPAQLLRELEEVRADALAAAESHDRQLRALRQQHEQLKAQYAAAAAVSTEMAHQSASIPLNLSRTHGAPNQQAGGSDAASATSASAAKREHALRARAEAAELELERVRAFYTAKVKTLSSQVKGLTAASAPTPPASSGRASASAHVTHISGGSSRLRKGSRSTFAQTLSSGTQQQMKSPDRDMVHQSSEPPHDSRRGSTAAASTGVESQTLDAAPASAVNATLAISTPSPVLAPVAQDTTRAHVDPQTPVETLQAAVVTSSQIQAELDAVSRRVEAAEQRIKALADGGSSAAVLQHTGVVKLTGGTAASNAQSSPTPHIARLYAAIDVLEARAEARELELVRAERAVHSAQEVILDAERNRFREALRVKDDALERCKRELLRLMAQLQPH